jgi:hypothetical protein
MPTPWFTISEIPKDESIAKRVEELRTRDGRHEILTSDDGVTLYVEIKDSEISGYNAVNSAGEPIDGGILRLDGDTPIIGLPVACAYCIRYLGHLICVVVPCPPQVVH